MLLLTPAAFCRDEPSPLLAVRPQLPPGVPAAERLHAGRHLQTGRVPLEAGAGETRVRVFRRATGSRCLFAVRLNKKSDDFSGVFEDGELKVSCAPLGSALPRVVATRWHATG